MPDDTCPTCGGRTRFPRLEDARTRPLLKQRRDIWRRQRFSVPFYQLCIASSHADAQGIMYLLDNVDLEKLGLHFPQTYVIRQRRADIDYDPKRIGPVLHRSRHDADDDNDDQSAD